MTSKPVELCSHFTLFFPTDIPCLFSSFGLVISLEPLPKVFVSSNFFCLDVWIDFVLFAYSHVQAELLAVIVCPRCVLQGNVGGIV